MFQFVKKGWICSVVLRRPYLVASFQQLMRLVISILIEKHCTLLAGTRNHSFFLVEDSMTYLY
jgi:hypothetical protein